MLAGTGTGSTAGGTVGSTYRQAGNVLSNAPLPSQAGGVGSGGSGGGGGVLASSGGLVNNPGLAASVLQGQGQGQGQGSVTNASLNLNTLAAPGTAGGGGGGGVDLNALQR